MKPILTFAICLALLAAGGCTDPDHYPVSGQECSPQDPVLELDANDCTPPV